MSISRLAPIDLDIDDSMLVAVQQILWFKENGFTLPTVRALTFLHPDPKATWDQTCEELAEIWESIRHAEDPAGKAQADHRQVSVGFRGTSAGTGQGISRSGTEESLRGLWPDHGVVGAHISAGGRAGMALKAGDDCTDWLCFYCHLRQHDNPGPEWWYEEVRREPTTLSPQDWLDQVYIPSASAHTNDGE